jgi:bifunctional non-homologous end joining protein LigD
MNPNIFDACRKGNLELVKKHIKEGVDLTQFNDYGFTALQCAAIGSDGADSKITLAILKSLIEAGVDLQTESKDKRTALYLLSEFSESVEPVKYLIDQGAIVDVFDEHGNHITKNARTPEVQQFLMELTGVTTTKEPEFESINMDSKKWKLVKKAIIQVFLKLENKGLIAMSLAGNTQDDGFLACSEVYRNHPNSKTITGFCFYTKQDSKRAKKTSILMLGYGGTDGKNKSTVKVGQLIVEAFEQANFEVQWSGKSSDRPTVRLHKYSVKNKS